MLKPFLMGSKGRADQNRIEEASPISETGGQGANLPERATPAPPPKELPPWPVVVLEDLRWPPPLTTSPEIAKMIQSLADGKIEVLPWVLEMRGQRLRRNARIASWCPSPGVRPSQSLSRARVTSSLLRVLKDRLLYRSVPRMLALGRRSLARVQAVQAKPGQVSLRPHRRHRVD